MSQFENNTPPNTKSVTPTPSTVTDTALSSQAANPNTTSGLATDSTDGPTSASRTPVGHLELLEERAVVNKERLDVGKVTVTKHQRTKTVDVPIELVEEVLTIRTEYQDAESEALLTGKYDEKDVLRRVEPSLDSVAVVTINGNRIELGNDPVEIVLSRQVATITKDTYLVQEIDVEKSVHTHSDTIAVELKYEELDVTEEGFLDHKKD